MLSKRFPYVYRDGGGVEGGFTAVSVSLLEGCQCSEGKGGMTLTPDQVSTKKWRPVTLSIT